MRNETEGEERRRVVRHLLAGCARCVAVTRRFWSLGEGGQMELPGDPHPASYGGIFERLAEEGFRRERMRYREAGSTGTRRPPRGAARPAALGGPGPRRDRPAVPDPRRLRAS